MKTERRIYYFLFCIILTIKLNYVYGGCGPGEKETFERVTGSVPQTQGETLLLARGPNTTPLATECALKCLNASDTCQSFVVDYYQNACFNVSVASSDDIFGFQPTDFFQAASVVFFNKICIKAGPSCGDQLGWLLERVPGFELRTSHALALSEVPSRLSCAALCLSESRFPCKSAQYDPLTKKCRLSTEDRRTVPHAFVPTLGTAEYMENQCTQFQHSSNQVCSFEEFRESTLNLTDVSVDGVTYQQCRQLCELERRFRCRGFTFAVSAEKIVIVESSRCLLHSADIASAGPNALVAMSGALYSERAPCLDLILRCSKNQITMKLRTPDPFYGRIFVRGHANMCDTAGSGKNETALVVGPKCAAFTETGVNVAIVVQYNAILQRRGDRALNVTCMYGDSLLAAVNGSIQVAGDPFLGGAVAVNSSDVASAAVRIVITDRLGREASITEVGRDLELRLIAANTDPFDIAAGQLIASNVEGTESVLLLDERGCPPDPATFPALQKVPGSRDLVARFRAFRFTSSTVVRFHVRVHFCLQVCPSVNCGTAGDSYGRKRRDDTGNVEQELAWSLVPANNATARAAQVTAGFPTEMPLEMDIFVLPDPHAVIKIQSNESGTYAGEPVIIDIPVDAGDKGRHSDWWCISDGVFIGVLVSWILLQIIVVAGVWIAARAFALSDAAPSHSPNSSVKLRNVRWQGSGEAFS